MRSCEIEKLLKASPEEIVREILLLPTDEEFFFAVRALARTRYGNDSLLGSRAVFNRLKKCRQDKTLMSVVKPRKANTGSWFELYCNILRKNTKINKRSVVARWFRLVWLFKTPFVRRMRNTWIIVKPQLRLERHYFAD